MSSMVQRLLILDLDVLWDHPQVAGRLPRSVYEGHSVHILHKGGGEEVKEKEEEKKQEKKRKLLGY